MKGFAVLYSKDLPYFTELGAHFLSDGWGKVRVSGNYAGRAQIGVYETSIASEDVANLKAKLVAANYRNLPQPERRTEQMPMPGTPDVPGWVVGIWDFPAKVPEIGGFDLGLIPPEIQPVVDDLEAHVGAVLEHPKCVLADTARWEKAELRAGDELLFSVTLKNIGTHDIRLASPGRPDADSKDLPWTLTLAHPGPPGEGDIMVENGGFRLNPGNLRQESSQRRLWSADEMKLAPGQELQIKFKKKAHLSPGSYTALLIFSSRDDMSQDDLVGGALQVALPLLKVTGK